jgi:SAM-dependent MidA family methyltransferase
VNTIPFSKYMHNSLYEPGKGYYVAGRHKLGEGGDFITAPMISPLFSQALAKQCIDIFKTLNTPSILEFGAGTGQMAFDLLRYLKKHDQLPAHYYILEVSADLIDRQQQLLKRDNEIFERITWLDQLPENFTGIVLANEVLDAMPVEVFRWHDSGVRQAYVDMDDATHFSWQEPDDALSLSVSALNTALPEGYQSEINQNIPSWIEQLHDMMDEGVCLLIDYGFVRREYYHPDRAMGTLMCHYQHQAIPDPFYRPGECDITAHVDFTHVAEACDDAGFQVAGFATQAHFLMNCGLLDLAKAQTVQDQMTQSRAIQKLLMPHEMGELFKVIAFTKQYDAPLLGFLKGDQRVRL